jgi:hypothetical protein
MNEIKHNTPREQVAAAAAAAAQAVVSSAPLVGTWSACNKKTRDIVRVVITASGASLSVQVFGACTPTPCDWGVVGGTAYAVDVGSTDAIAFTAQYKFSFKTAIVTGLLDQGSLILETYNTFTDGSGRSNYYSRSYMCKG